MAHPGWHTRARMLCGATGVGGDEQLGRLGAPEVALNSCSELSVVNGGKHPGVGERRGSGGDELQFPLQFANTLLSILEGAHLFVGKASESLLRQHLDLLIEHV